MKTSPSAVLVVDDDPLITRLLSRVLGRWGYDVATAATGAEAMRSAMDADFDVLLVDQHLGGTEGSVLLEELEVRLAAARRRVPAMILMSGEYGTWPRPMVAKPFDFDVLRSLLDDAAAGRLAG